MVDMQNLLTAFSTTECAASFMFGFLSCCIIRWSPRFLRYRRTISDKSKDIQNLNERLEASLAQIQNLQTELESKNKEIAVLEKSYIPAWIAPALNHTLRFGVYKFSSSSSPV